jgi:hypothetical protein
VLAAEPGADGRPAVAPRQLAEAGEADRAVVAIHDPQLETHPVLALAREPLDELERLGLVLVGAPGEEARDLGVARQVEQRRGVVGDEVPQAQGRAAQDHPTETTPPV